MEGSVALPPEMQAAIASNPELQAAVAAQLGITPEQVAAVVAGQAQQPAAPVQPVAAAGQHVVAPGTVVADGVEASPAETPEQRLQRELAVSQQELQQTRKAMQTIEEGRVVGSSGQGAPGVPLVPTLATVEPGLRWAVRNGLVAIESIADPLIRDLFAADKGGVI